MVWVSRVDITFKGRLPAWEGGEGASRMGHSAKWCRKFIFDIEKRGLPEGYVEI